MVGYVGLIYAFLADALVFKYVFELEQYILMFCLLLVNLTVLFQNSLPRLK